MPYSRPPLSQLEQMAAQDINASLPGSDPLLRWSNLGIIGKLLAKLANLHYGYLDWISRMSVPVTAEDEYALAWGSLKNVNLKAATVAGTADGAGVVSFIKSTPGVPIPAGTPLVRGDNYGFTTKVDAEVAGDGTFTLEPIADAAGSAYNTPNGVTLTLGVSIPGIQSNGTVTSPITGGSDDETMADYISRMLQAYRQVPQGGAVADYIKWALEVPGVTRAWVNPIGMGVGTVVVFTMFDIAEAGNGGFPVGSNGVATNEPRDTAATGDQLAVANYIYGSNTVARQPATALVYSVAPTPSPQNFTIAHMPAGTALRAQVAAAISGVFLEFGSPGDVPVNGLPGGIIDLSDIEAAIAAVPGTEGFVITAPTDNITLAAGALPTLGVITYI